MGSSRIVYLGLTHFAINKYEVVAARLMIAFCSYHDTCSLIRAVPSLTKAMKEAKMCVFWETALKEKVREMKTKVCLGSNRLVPGLNS